MSLTSVSTHHPYSPAYIAGGLVFVSGALSIDPEALPSRAAPKPSTPRSTA